MEATREECKQADELKTLRSDVMRCMCNLLRQQPAAWAAGFTAARFWQSPGEQRRDSASTALRMAPSCRWLCLSRRQPCNDVVQP